MTDPNAAEYYNRRFKQTVTENLKLYWQARKIKVSVAPTTRLTALLDDRNHPVVLQELHNWENTESLSTLAIDPKVEEKIVDLGKEVAFTVELLLRMEAGKYGSAKDVRNLYVTDIFERTDGTPNLALNIVTNAPLSVIDPAGLIPGWVAYKFFFACGFPAKAESDYVFSSQTEQAVAAI